MSVVQGSSVPHILLVLASHKTFPEVYRAFCRSNLYRTIQEPGGERLGEFLFQKEAPVFVIGSSLRVQCKGFVLALTIAVC